MSDQCGQRNHCDRYLSVTLVFQLLDNGLDSVLVCGVSWSLRIVHALCLAYRI